jgi:hypothetical protein
LVLLTVVLLVLLAVPVCVAVMFPPTHEHIMLLLTTVPVAAMAWDGLRRFFGGLGYRQPAPALIPPTPRFPEETMAHKGAWAEKQVWEALCAQNRTSRARVEIKKRTR